MAFLPPISTKPGTSSACVTPIINPRALTCPIPVHRSQRNHPVQFPISMVPPLKMSTGVAFTTLSAGVGTSTLPSTDEAVFAAVTQASESLSSKEPTVAIVLTTVDRQMLDVQAAVKKHLRNIPIHGATSCAATLTNDGPQKNAISVMLLHAPEQLSIASTAISDTISPTDAARTAANQLNETLNGDVANVILFASPGVEESVLTTISDILPSAEIFGGSAADNTVEGNWSVFNEQSSFSTGVSLLGLTANVKFAAQLVPPYRPGSISAEVTAASGRCIKSLDGKPAAQMLNQWIGPSVNEKAMNGGSIIVESATVPLGVERGNGEYISVHAAEITDEKAVGFFAEVATGEKLVKMENLGEGDAATAAAIGLEMAYTQAMEKGDIQAPKAGILIYCGGLSIAVGDNLAKSLEGMKDKAPLLGMTAFGEQGSFTNKNNVHSNLAVGIALFG